MRIVGVLLLVVAGLPIGYLLTRRLPLALLIAPLISGLTTAGAVMLMLACGGDLRIWLAVLLALEIALAAWRYRAHARPAPHGTWVDLLWLALPLVPPALLVFAPATHWDAHSIWWTHAGYFLHGAEFARHDIGAAAYQYSHTDYPPLASAAVAAVWSVLPGRGFMAAQFATTALSLSAIGTLGYAVRVVTARAPKMVSRLAGVAVALAAWGTAPGAVTNGYADPLWSATLVAAAVLLLFADRPLTRPALPVLLLTATVLTKNEALPAVLTVAALTVLRVAFARPATGQGLRRILPTWPVVLPVLAGAGWMGLVRHFGAQSDVATGDGIKRLLTGDPTTWHRVHPVAAGLWHTIGLTMALAVLLALLCAVWLRRDRRLLGLGWDGWLWLVALGYTLSLAAIYVMNTAINLHWWLSTSLNRVVLPLNMLACVSAACWGVAAWQRWRVPAKASIADQPAAADAATPDEPAPMPDKPAADTKTVPPAVPQPTTGY